MFYNILANYPNYGNCEITVCAYSYLSSGRRTNEMAVNNNLKQRIKLLTVALWSVLNDDVSVVLLCRGGLVVSAR